MKELIRYKSFCNVIVFLTVFIICICAYIANSKMIFLLIVSGILLIINILLFLEEHEKAKKISKNGKFVLGILEKNSVKLHHLGKGLYMLKASVKYYDDQKKMTLRFDGYDIFDHLELRVRKIKEENIKSENLEVLVGYLPEQPEICELYLKEAFEKT